MDQRFGEVVIVTGSRDWSDRTEIERSLTELMPHLVVEGGCPTGADAIARDWCKRQQIDNFTAYAKWIRAGRAAGMIRNRRMLDMFPTATVLAFPLPGGRGTQGCIAEAKKRDMHVCVYGDEGWWV